MVLKKTREDKIIDHLVLSQRQIGQLRIIKREMETAMSKQESFSFSFCPTEYHDYELWLVTYDQIKAVLKVVESLIEYHTAIIKFHLRD